MAPLRVLRVAQMGDSKDSTKRNLPLLRAVKEGKIETITKLLESGEVDVNFQNHCAHDPRCVRHGHALHWRARGPQDMTRPPARTDCRARWSW